MKNYQFVILCVLGLAVAIGVYSNGEGGSGFLGGGQSLTNLATSTQFAVTTTSQQILAGGYYNIIHVCNHGGDAAFLGFGRTVSSTYDGYKLAAQVCKTFDVNDRWVAGFYAAASSSATRMGVVAY